MPSLTGKGRAARWRGLLYGAQLLNESLLEEKNPRTHVELALAYLGNIQELFPKEIEPVEDFEGYSVREFAKALQQVLIRVRDAELVHHNSTSR